MDKTEVTGSMVIPPNGNASVILYPSIKAFYFPSLFVTTELSTILGVLFDSVYFMRSNKRNVVFAFQ